MPLLIVTVEAYVVVHGNVAEFPGGTVAGETVRIAVAMPVSPSEMLALRVDWVRCSHPAQMN